jgi:hypothetical protein
MNEATRTGRVISSAYLAGSFRTVRLDSNPDELLTVGLAPGFELRGVVHPSVGTVIIVTGIEKDGRFLTSDWRFA